MFCGLLSRGAVLAAALLLLAGGAWSDNLVANSGFEEPQTPDGIPHWTFWRAPWGSGEAAVITTSKKVSGSRALLLTCTTSSFGVYQEIDATPGKAYQMDGWWKGDFPEGIRSWYDCELLDGPFDYATADDPELDKPYKVTMYDPAPASWDWEKMSDVYHRAPVMKNGILVASQNKITVVLKTGGYWHPYGYYDDITVTEVPSVSIAQARELPDGSAVVIESAVVTASFFDCFYVESEDRTAGIRVVWSSGVGIQGATGKIVGAVKTNQAGERFVEASQVTWIAPPPQ